MNQSSEITIYNLRYYFNFNPKQIPFCVRIHFFSVFEQFLAGDASARGFYGKHLKKASLQFFQSFCLSKKDHLLLSFALFDEIDDRIISHAMVSD